MLWQVYHLAQPRQKERVAYFRTCTPCWQILKATGTGETVACIFAEAVLLLSILQGCDPVPKYHPIGMPRSTLMCMRKHGNRFATMYMDSQPNLNFPLNVHSTMRW